MDRQDKQARRFDHVETWVFDLDSTLYAHHLNIWQQVEHLSTGMTLEPGDVLFTGTPGGVGAAMNPRQFLAPGDIVRCEVDGLGYIEGVMVGES